METGNVNLTISKDIVNPIVQAKINEAIIAAMGGGQELINKVVTSILNEPVASDGKKSNYQSDNKYRWIDLAVTSQIQAAVKEAITEILSSRKDEIKQAIVKQLSNRKGIEQFAEALLNGTAKLSELYRQTINVNFDKL